MNKWKYPINKSLCCCLVAKSCLTLVISQTVAHQDPLSMGFPRNTGLGCNTVGCHFLLQGIFLIQGLNLCLLHCRQILYRWATRKSNKSINNAILTRLVYALTGFIFVCGCYYAPWVYGCLDNWCMNRQCLLDYPTVGLTVHNQTEISHWLAPQNLHCWAKRDLPGGIHYSGFTFFGRPLLPWLVSVNVAMIRNLYFNSKDT